MSGCYLIIQQSGYEDRVFPVGSDRLIIGRGKDAGLQLPNVSVSRRHLQLAQQGSRWVVVDLESNNGTLLSREPLRPGVAYPLSTEDTLQIGIFKLIVLIAVGRSVPVWRGQFVHQLPGYIPPSSAPETAATFGLDRATLVRMAESEHRLETGRICQIGEAGRHWVPGDRVLTLGRNNQIPVFGLLVAARAAQISWDDRSHVIESLSWWTTVRLNGQPLAGLAPLSPGSHIRIGRSAFRYEVPPSDRLELLKARSAPVREHVQIPASRPPPPPPQLLEEDEPTEELVR